MPEAPNAWQCDYCNRLMIPTERKTENWHTKWCSFCRRKIYDVYIGDEGVSDHVLKLVKRIEEDPALSCNLLPSERRAWENYWRKRNGRQS